MLTSDYKNSKIAGKETRKDTKDVLRYDSDSDDNDFIELPEVEMFPELFEEHRIVVPPPGGAILGGSNNPSALDNPSSPTNTPFEPTNTGNSCKSAQSSSPPTLRGSRKHRWSGKVEQHRNDPTTGVRELSPKLFFKYF